MSYLDLTITEIHEALVAKKTTPLELVQEAIIRAKANPDNAFELILEKEALEIAAALGEVEVDNPLWGIPFVSKDNYATRDIVTTASSDVLNGYRPLFNATVIDRLLENKAILIGKTTLDELAMGGTGTTGHKGITYNPFDPKHERMIGGSSCGSAAAVAASIVPLALGSDTGDSVRKPAGYAGLVGMKPTWGRVSRYGLFPFAPSLDHVGYFTRSIADAALVTKVLSGHDDKDATSSRRPVAEYEAGLASGVKGMRIAVLHEIVNSKHEPYVKSSFDHLVGCLTQAGAIVDRVHFRKDLLEAIYPMYITIASAEATSNDANLDGVKFGPSFWGATYEEAILKARTAGFSELIKRRFIIGSFALLRENQAALFTRAQKGRRLIVQELDKIFGDYDLILSPTAPNIAPKFEDKTDKFSDQYLIADNHLVLGNFAGLPSLTVPCGLERGMPYGVNVMGRAFAEADVLRLGAAIERMTGLKNLSAPKEVRL
jgi:aspartyl-tRNA(Asn)/glutamyl-tRNA(Gln) amidotransferase subunit A